MCRCCCFTCSASVRNTADKQEVDTFSPLNAARLFLFRKNFSSSGLFHVFPGGPVAWLSGYRDGNRPRARGGALRQLEPRSSSCLILFLSCSPMSARGFVFVARIFTASPNRPVSAYRSFRLCDCFIRLKS
ncbi:hypothetical protein LDENG_00007290, partial [Lucifuga dentata]